MNGGVCVWLRLLYFNFANALHSGQKHTDSFTLAERSLFFTICHTSLGHSPGAPKG